MAVQMDMSSKALESIEPTRAQLVMGDWAFTKETGSATKPLCFLRRSLVAAHRHRSPSTNSTVAGKLQTKTDVSGNRMQAETREIGVLGRQMERLAPVGIQLLGTARAQGYRIIGPRLKLRLKLKLEMSLTLCCTARCTIACVLCHLRRDAFCKLSAFEDLR